MLVSKFSSFDLCIHTLHTHSGCQDIHTAVLGPGTTPSPPEPALTWALSPRRVTGKGRGLSCPHTYVSHVSAFPQPPNQQSWKKCFTTWISVTFWCWEGTWTQGRSAWSLTMASSTSDTWMPPTPLQATPSTVRPCSALSPGGLLSEWPHPGSHGAMALGHLWKCGQVRGP